jgi:hypothetical protein
MPCGWQPLATTTGLDLVRQRGTQVPGLPFPKTGSRPLDRSQVPGRMSPGCWAMVVRAVNSVLSVFFILASYWR